MAEIRKVGSGPAFVDAVSDSLSPCIVLLNDLFSRLKLKDEPVQCFFAASDAEIKEFWSAVLRVDSTLEYVSYSKANVSGQQSLLDFMDHCCQRRHYSFDILKCGLPNCTICKPPRLPKEDFVKLHHLPDPVIGDDDHYQPFSKVFGTQTTEKDWPSAQKSKDGGRRFTLKHVKNANLMLMCEECSLWRLLYSCTKLSAEEQGNVQDKLADVSCTCGSPIEDLGDDLVTSVYANLKLLRIGWKALLQCWVRSNLCVLWFYGQFECARRLLSPSTVCPLFRQKENYKVVYIGVVFFFAFKYNCLKVGLHLFQCV